MATVIDKVTIICDSPDEYATWQKTRDAQALLKSDTSYGLREDDDRANSITVTIKGVQREAPPPKP